MLDAALAEAHENGYIEEGDIIDDRENSEEIADEILKNEIPEKQANDKDKNMAKAVADSEKGDDIYGDSSEEKKDQGKKESKNYIDEALE